MTTPTNPQAACGNTPYDEGPFTLAQQTAPSAAAAWEHHARKLTQWLHCMSHNDSYFGEPAGLVKRVTGELNRLIGAAPQPTPTPQADSVLEDAARLLESQHTWLTNVAAANLVRSLAARKQGATPI